MYPLNDTPSPAVLFTIAIFTAGVAAILLRRGSVLEVGALAALFAALAYTIFEMVIEGFGPLFMIGIGLTFLFNLPIAVAIIWIIRRIRQQIVRGD